MKQFLVLEDFTPLPLNAHTRGKIRQGIRLRKKDKELVGYFARQQGITASTGRVRVDLFIVVSPGQRRPDEDSLWKSILDSLVSAGVLVNDSPGWCHVGRVLWFRGLRRMTVVSLTELAEASILPVEELGNYIPKAVYDRVSAAADLGKK